MEVRSKSAVALIEKHLDRLPHDEGLIRLVMFNHDSPGLRKLRRQIAEALVKLLESDPAVRAELAQ